MTTTTYAAREQSRVESEPIELYRFSRLNPALTDAEEVWTYANADIAVTYDNGTGDQIYTPLPGIHRGEIQQNGETYSMSVEVDIPLQVGACVTDEFRGTNVPFPVRMQIIRWQRGLADTEVALIFTGEVSGSSFDESLCHLSGTSEEAAWGNALVRTYCQRTCPHMLYDSFCGASRTAVEASYHALTISADFLTIQIDEWPDTVGGVGYLDTGSQMLVGGMVLAFDLAFLIVKQVDDVLTLQTPLPAITDTSTILTISPGCNRQVTDCYTVFDNLERFGGFPLMPDRSPWLSIQ